MEKVNMGFYIRIRREPNDSKEDILQEMLALKDAKKSALVYINGSEISNYDDDLEERINNAYVGLEAANFEKDLNKQRTLLKNIEKMKDNKAFKFYFGLVKRDVIDSKMEAFEEEIFMGDLEHQLEVLGYVAYLKALLNLEDSEMFANLVTLFQSLDESKEATFDEAIEMMRKYDEDGDIIDKAIFSDSLDEVVERKKQYIKTMEQEIKKI